MRRVIGIFITILMLLPTVPTMISPSVKADTMGKTVVDINVAIHNGSVYTSGATHEPFFPVLERHS